MTQPVRVVEVNRVLIINTRDVSTFSRAWRFGAAQPEASAVFGATVELQVI